MMPSCISSCTCTILCCINVYTVRHIAPLLLQPSGYRKVTELILKIIYPWIEIRLVPETCNEIRSPKSRE